MQFRCAHLTGVFGPGIRESCQDSGGESSYSQGGMSLSDSRRKPAAVRVKRAPKIIPVDQGAAILRRVANIQCWPRHDIRRSPVNLPLQKRRLAAQ